jgi:arylsulfatase A-like enzyme/lysophospholipase L1-like esterase
MRSFAHPALALVIGLLVSSLSAAAPAGKPNILFFLVDDMGWQETSVPFHSETTALNQRYHTPNMQRLAGDALKFTQAYASAVCSPTRVSAISGMSAARHRVTNWTLRKNVSPDTPLAGIAPPDWNLNGIATTGGLERTTQVTPLPMLLREAGYRSIHVGKAHFGAKDTPGEDPRHFGFDVNIAGHAAGGPGSYWGDKNFSAAWRTKGRELIWDVPGLGKYHGQDINLTEALTREALVEMEKAVAAKTPFYLYMSHYAVHAPWEEDRRFYQKYLDSGLKPFEAKLASMIESMDKSLGDLMDACERLGIADNTIILFISDNGSPSQCPRNLPLRGHKVSPYEGGNRVPMLVKWPGVTRAGSSCATPVVIEDFFPTILEMADVQWQGRTVQKVDGMSFVPLLRGEPGAADRAMVWHFPHHYGVPPFSAIRKGPWKLIHHHADRRLELFNLESDIGEARNLSAEEPARLAELAHLLTDRLREMDAQMPLDTSTHREVPAAVELVDAAKPAAAVPQPTVPDGAAPPPAPPLRVACIGDSITLGPGGADSYPAKLGGLLGNGYEVRNFGVGGTTLLAGGDRPYQKTKASRDAAGFDPQIVIVMLGTNDSCGLPRGNWEKSAAFATDAAAMLRSLAKPGRRVIVALPTPMLPDRPVLKPERVTDLRERAPRLSAIRDWWRQEAAKLGIEIVDLSDVFDADPAWTTDGVHPTPAGYSRIAARIAGTLLGAPGKPGR